MNVINELDESNYATTAAKVVVDLDGQKDENNNDLLLTSKLNDTSTISITLSTSADDNDADEEEEDEDEETGGGEEEVTRL